MVLAAFGFPQQVPKNLAHLPGGDPRRVHGQGESLQILGAALVGGEQGGAKAALPIPGHRKAESAVLGYQVAPVVTIFPAPLLGQKGLALPFHHRFQRLLDGFPNHLIQPALTCPKLVHGVPPVSSTGTPFRLGGATQDLKRYRSPRRKK